MVTEYRRGQYSLSPSLFNLYNSYLLYVYLSLFTLQHANEDVEKMILGNKCDMTDKRIVSKERGEAVRQQLQIRPVDNIL